MDCPNCLTQYKCNGPHIEKSYEGLYKSIDGYYIFNKEHKEYMFIPCEKEFSSELLQNQIAILEFLNEKCTNTI